MRLVLMTVMLIAPSTASAFCFQSTGYDLSSYVNGAVDWLVCLNNEQNKALDTQARRIGDIASTVSQNAGIANSNSRSVDVLASEVAALSRDVYQLQTRILNLETENSDLKAQMSHLVQ